MKMKTIKEAAREYLESCSKNPDAKVKAIGNDRIMMENLFFREFESEAILNIQKFAKLAENMNLKVEVGFSGGKDSIVTYDLVKRSGINHIAVFNYAFESPDVVNFIRENYENVIISKKEKSYYQIITEKRLLPSQQIRYCCNFFKENSKNATIVGVRCSESVGRRNRKTFEAGKRFFSRNKDFDVFNIECTAIKKGEIQLKPIVYWSDSDVWGYIKRYNLHYPNLYNEGQRRCGCMMCPLATLDSNLYYFEKYPNLLNFSKKIAVFNDLQILATGKKYTAEQMLFCWLNRFKEPSEKDKIRINKIYNRNIFH